MPIMRFVGTNQEFGEWLKISWRILLFISHLEKRQIVPPFPGVTARRQSHPPASFCA